jgi:DNA-binding transcriptional ArsR family regulator
LPASVRYDENLSAQEKLLYSEITCLTSATGICVAGNTYFARLYKVDPRTVSRWVEALEKGGYIRREIEGRSKRHIRLVGHEKLPPMETITAAEKVAPAAPERAPAGLYEEVMQLWNKTFGCNQVLTDKKRAMLAARLRTFSPQQLLEAVEKRYLVTRDAWYQQAEQQKYIDRFELVFRDDEQLDKTLSARLQPAAGQPDKGFRPFSLG